MYGQVLPLGVISTTFIAIAYSYFLFNFSNSNLSSQVIFHLIIWWIFFNPVPVECNFDHSWNRLPQFNNTWASLLFVIVAATPWASLFEEAVVGSYLRHAVSFWTQRITVRWSCLSYCVSYLHVQILVDLWLWQHSKSHTFVHTFTLFSIVPIQQCVSCVCVCV